MIVEFKWMKMMDAYLCDSIVLYEKAVEITFRFFFSVVIFSTKHFVLNYFQT